MSTLDHTDNSFRREPSYRLAIAPPRFNFDDPGSWMEWKKAYQRYHRLARLTEQPNELQIETLLNVMGLGADNFFEQLAESDKKEYDKVMKGFDKFFAPWSNKAQHIVQFNGRTQRDNESNEQYIKSLAELAAKCDFGKERENHIKYRLLTGMKDTALSAELIQEFPDDLTMDTVTSRMIEKHKYEPGGTAKNLTVALPGFTSASQHNMMPAGYNMPQGPGNMIEGTMPAQQRNMMSSGNAAYQQQQQPMTSMPRQPIMSIALQQRMGQDGQPQQRMMSMNQPVAFANNPQQQSVTDMICDLWLK